MENKIEFKKLIILYIDGTQDIFMDNSYQLLGEFMYIDFTKKKNIIIRLSSIKKYLEEF